MIKTLKYNFDDIVGYEDTYSHIGGHSTRQVTYDGEYEYDVCAYDIALKIAEDYGEERNATVITMIEQLIDDDFIDIDSEGMEDWLQDKFEEDARLEAQNG